MKDLKVLKRDGKEYAVKLNPQGKVQAIRNITSNKAIPLNTDTARKIIKGDRRYTEVIL